jgi:hypothetical protein
VSAVLVVAMSRAASIGLLTVTPVVIVALLLVGFFVTRRRSP